MQSLTSVKDSLTPRAHVPKNSAKNLVNWRRYGYFTNPPPLSWHGFMGFSHPMSPGSTAQKPPVPGFNSSETPCPRVQRPRNPMSHVPGFNGMVPSLISLGSKPYESQAQSHSLKTPKSLSERSPSQPESEERAIPPSPSALSDPKRKRKRLQLVSGGSEGA